MVKVVPVFEKDMPSHLLSAEELFGCCCKNSAMYRVGLLMHTLLIGPLEANCGPICNFSDAFNEFLQRKCFPLIGSEFEKKNPRLTEIIRQLLLNDWKSRMSCEELNQSLENFLK